MEQFHFDFFINVINFDRDNIRDFPCIVIIEYYVEILFFKFLYHMILNCLLYTSPSQRDS